MAVSSEYGEYLLERLNLFASTRGRKMFGGLGFFHVNLMYALASKNVLYFKVDDGNRSDYEKAGMKPFRPFGRKSYTMSYYEVPADVIEDDNLICHWASKAYQAALDNCKSSASRRS